MPSFRTLTPPRRAALLAATFLTVALPATIGCELDPTPIGQPGPVVVEACRIELRIILDAYEAYTAKTGHAPSSYDDLLEADVPFLFDDPSERWPFQSDIGDYTTESVATGACTGVTVA